MFLDEKNKIILYELHNNARIPLKELAKKIRLSKEGTFARIKQLEKKQVIAGYVTNINLEKIGWKLCKIYAYLHNTTINKEKEIQNYLINSELVTNAANSTQEEEILFTIKGRSNQEIDNFIIELKQKYQEYIEIKKVITPTLIENYPRRYLCKNNTEISTIIVNTEYIAISKDEKRILEILGQNPIISGIQLANMLNISPTTAIKRVKELQKKEVILNYAAIINVEKIGIIRFKAEIELNDINELNNLKEFCRYHKNIIYFIRFIDSFDAELKIECESNEALNTIIKEMKKAVNYNIQRINVYTETRLLKVKYT